MSDVHSRPLLESEAAADAFVQFGRWYADAADVVRVPEAVALATAALDGRPSLRMVLCKGWSEAGFVFHTNYSSRKGEELAANPQAALLFYWDGLGRQVRIEGSVERLPSSESDEYFATRPLGAQIGARGSRQSQPVADRDVLDLRIQAVSDQFAGRDIPRPDWWGGFRLNPDMLEFWQNREDRLHDRLLYRRSEGGWSRVRLQP